MDDPLLRPADGDAPVKRHRSTIRVAMDGFRKLGSTRRKHLSSREAVQLSYWQKWMQRGIFPWKLCLHLLLVAGATLQVGYVFSQDAAYIRASLRSWRFLYFPEDTDVTEASADLYSVDDAVACVHRSLDNYFNIANVSLDALSYPTPGAPTVTMQTVRFRNPGRLVAFSESDGVLETEAVTTTLTPSDFGPLPRNVSQVAAHAFFSSLVSMRLEFTARGRAFGRAYSNCYTWRVAITYDFSHRGHIRLLLSDHDRSSCNAPFTADHFITHWFLLDAIVAALAIVYQTLVLRALLRRCRIFFDLRRKVRRAKRRRASTRGSSGVPSPAGPGRRVRFAGSDSKAGPGDEAGAVGSEGVGSPALSLGASQEPLLGAWGKLKWRDKLVFFDVWLVVITTANLSIVVASVADAASTSPIAAFGRVFAGLGCGLLWVGLLRYLEHNKRFYTLVLTLRRGLPPIMRFMVGVVPILLAYAFFGMVYFGDNTPRFGDFQASLITLFAVLNGDIIRETFMDLQPFAPVVSQIYLYSFVCLFIYVVLNIFVATIELAFFTTCVDNLTSKEGDIYFHAREHTQEVPNEDGPHEQTSTLTHTHPTRMPRETSAIDAVMREAERLSSSGLATNAAAAPAAVRGDHAPAHDDDAAGEWADDAGKAAGRPGMAVTALDSTLHGALQSEFDAFVASLAQDLAVQRSADGAEQSQAALVDAQRSAFARLRREMRKLAAGDA